MVKKVVHLRTTRGWGPARIGPKLGLPISATGTVHKRTRPYRPQTNGEVERFHRTLATEWAYARLYSSEAARRRALPTWLHIYNHHRHHTALGGLPPASRVINLRGQYT